MNKIYMSNGKPINDADVIEFYKNNSSKQTAEHFGLKNSEIQAITQRNKFFKINTIKDPEIPKLKPIPPVGAKVRINDVIKIVVGSYKHFFRVNGMVEAVHRSDCWELVG